MCDSPREGGYEFDVEVATPASMTAKGWFQLVQTESKVNTGYSLALYVAQ
jgi:hypothetical protein